MLACITMTTTSTLGALIRESRLAKGMSMGQLASAVGRTAASVRRWERDEVVPGADVVERLAAVLELDLDDLAALVGPQGDDEESAETPEPIAPIAVETDAMPLP
ncbi:MAG: XRE family transcriptional regulator, partial [Actinobacteria bacterium]